MNKKAHVQVIMKLPLARQSGQSVRENRTENLLLREKIKADGETIRYSPQDLLSFLLKRQAREAMSCVTECDAIHVPAHLARLRDLEETIRFAMNHLLVPVNDCGRSDKNLLNAHTLADFLECILLTKKQHRAPACVSQRDADWARVERKLDLIAGALVRDPEILEKLFGGEQ